MSKDFTLIYEYLKRYQKDPTSRIFAPLAEAYRKAGKTEEAVHIAKEGLRFHPQFVGGKVALARALFDRQDYRAVTEALASVIQDAPDNLAAQRLMADSYLLLGQVGNALQCYKFLLYFHPSDQETARLIQELETRGYESGELMLRDEPREKTKNFEVKQVGQILSDAPELKRAVWVRKIECLQEMLQKVERYRSLS